MGDKRMDADLEAILSWPEANLVRRIRELESDATGRCLVQSDLLMADGQWRVELVRPRKLERLGEKSGEDLLFTGYTYW